MRKRERFERDLKRESGETRCPRRERKGQGSQGGRSSLQGGAAPQASFIQKACRGVQAWFYWALPGKLPRPGLAQPASQEPGRRAQEKGHWVTCQEA